MFGKRKLRNELHFIRQKLTREVISENVLAFELLLDKEDDLGGTFKKIQGKLYKDVKVSLKAVDLQTLRANRLVNKLENLHKYQEERSFKAFGWLKRYLEEKELEEEREFKNKYCSRLDEISLKEFFKSSAEEVNVIEDEEEIEEEDEELEEEVEEELDTGEKGTEEQEQEETPEEDSKQVLESLLSAENKESKNDTKRKNRAETGGEAR